MTAPALLAPRAVATSASRCATLCTAVGPTSTGNASGCPNSVSRVSIRETSTRTRGRRRIRSSDSRSQRSVSPSAAPPWMYAAASGERRCCASVSKSERLTGCPFGDCAIAGRAGAATMEAPAPMTVRNASRRVMVRVTLALPGLAPVRRSIESLPAE